ncbi:arginyl-tRNA synthetase [Saccharothrix ecbatanensis]|uniref:Arginine--tRNA ligase n=1 Tax=Saccharothrix ecbatanensis TaxID=1105145 RepID=A0A7W9HHQ8_9PSEU|nr:arginine--tRNA ligase [Saccharothrix ecbatanensis]MBB5802261.1 arginyl-tRNA synthetase [Saccharothrix ecbatanensis]
MLGGDVGLELGLRVANALEAALDVEITPDEALIRPSAPGRGADYQCNVAMSLAKRLGRPPRDVAAAIVANLDAAEMVEPPEVAGPGFINLTLRREWLEDQTTRLLGDDRLGVPTAQDGTGGRKRYAIDYGSPNVAKEMHVGHLRSSIIGDAVVRMLEFAGHEVIRHNHLGDWGTPFGMLIEHLVDLGWTSGDHTISDLNGFYQEARKKFDADPEFADRSRRRVVALQGGDETTLALWRELVEESERHFATVYELLGVKLTAEDYYGESFYNPFLADVVDELEAKGLTAVSDGAVCVFPPGFTNREGEPLPLIVRKRDGGYGYASTDLATARYWTRERGATDLLYVVGSPQAQHFQMVFAVAREAGWLGDEHQAVHIGFGSILGEDGKVLRTRAGGSVKLVDLLREAVDRAAAVVAERSKMDAAQQEAVSRAVGIGAVKYADLSSDREKDYVFAWDRMLAMEGNTSVYLQYANARVPSVLARAGKQAEPGTPVLLGVTAERALALKLLQLPAALSTATAEYAPHKLCTYLYETAVAFSTFYENCPVVHAPDDRTRMSRLALAQLTSRVLTLGLSLLGIEAPDQL